MAITTTEANPQIAQIEYRASLVGDSVVRKRIECATGAACGAKLLTTERIDEDEEGATHHYFDSVCDHPDCPNLIRD